MTSWAHSSPWILGAIVVAALISWVWSRSNRKEAEEALATLEEMTALGEVVPDTIHPVVDLDRCIGSGACVHACPENSVLGIVRSHDGVVGARTGDPRQAPTTGDVICVVVGVEDVGDLQLFLACDLQVHVDVPARVHDHRLAGVGDHI